MLLVLETVPLVSCALQKSETPGPMKGRGFDLGVPIFVAIAFVAIVFVAACVALALLVDMLLVD